MLFDSVRKTLKVEPPSTSGSTDSRKLFDDLAPLPERQPPGGGQDSALSQAAVATVEIRTASCIATLTDQSGLGADRLRMLRMRLRQLRGCAKLQTVLVTSPVPGDGKSFVALNLASVLADGSEGAVLLIDGDLHKPSIAKTLDIPPSRGLAECLEFDLDPLQTLQFLKPLGFYLLQAGSTEASCTELIQSNKFAQMLERLKPHFEWILIDSPPVVPLSDALAIAEKADGTLLVVRAGKTSRDAVDEAVAKLGLHRIAMVVFNGAEELNKLYGKYAQYYKRK